MGAKIMSDYDIFKLFENFINEEDTTSEEEAAQEAVSEELDGKKLRATNKSKKDKTINQNEDESADEYTDEEVVEPKSPSTIYLKDALNYGKLKSVLNKFRASHSLKKPDITEELKDYYNRLSKSEKKALYVFIKGLVQITGDLEADGDDANIPSDFGLGVTQAGKTAEEKKDSQKSGDDAKKTAKKKGIEAPITVESIQDKREIYKILLENK